MRSVRAALASVAVVASVVLPSIAAASVMGSASFANCPSGGFEIQMPALDWLPPGTVAGTGCLTTGIATLLVYSGGTVGPGITGNIKDLNLANVPPPVDNFIDLPGSAPVIDFQLSGFTAPSPTNGTTCASLTPGQSCVPIAGSPILLTDESNGTTLTLAESGIVTDGVGPANDWNGVLTSQLSASPAAIQAVIVAAGGIVTGSWSENVHITPATGAPEPATLALLGLGLAGLGFSRRRKHT